MVSFVGSRVASFSEASSSSEGLKDEARVLYVGAQEEPLREAIVAMDGVC